MTSAPAAENHAPTRICDSASILPTKGTLSFISLEMDEKWHLVAEYFYACSFQCLLNILINVIKLQQYIAITRVRID